jgi:hypothetical protein
MSNWLDRLSIKPDQGQNQAPSRPYSPTPVPSSRNSFQLPSRSGQEQPQRPAQPIRPSLQARSTSLSLLSTTALPAAARIPRESSLKNQLEQTPDAETADPLQALNAILGIDVKEPDVSVVAIDEPNDSREDEITGKPPILAEDIDFGDLSLQDFIEQNAPRHARRARPHALPALGDCT